MNTHIEMRRSGRWHTNRRLLIIALAVAGFCVTLATPAQSHAEICTMYPIFCDSGTGGTGGGVTVAPTAPANPTHPSGTYKGYAYVRGLSICATGVTCVWAGELKVPSWRWTGTTWTKVEIASGTKVYVYPFSGNWRWVWTSTTGWIAMYHDRLLLGTDTCWNYTTWKYTCAVTGGGGGSVYDSVFGSTGSAVADDVYTKVFS